MALLKGYCAEERGRLALEAERKRGRRRVKMETPPQGQKRGELCVSLCPRLLKLSSSGNISTLLGPLGVAYCPLFSPGNGIRSSPNSNTFALVCSPQYVFVAKALASLNFFLLGDAFFLSLVWSGLTPAIRARIPALAISDLGAKTGSEGLKCRDCSQQHAFSLRAAALHSSARNSLTGCICICQRRGTDIILERACVRMRSGRCGFYGFPALN